MAATPDVHQLQHHCSSIGIELDEVDSLVGQAEAVDAHQVLGLTQAFGPDLHLPDLFECRPGIWHAIVSCHSTISRVLTFRKSKKLNKINRWLNMCSIRPLTWPSCSEEASEQRENHPYLQDGGGRVSLLHKFC